MTFIKKTWTDRQSEHPTRRKLVPTGNTNEYDVVRSEGAVSQEGDALNADNLNDLENRISNSVLSLETNLNGLSFKVMTEAEYNRLSTKDNNTLYFLTE